jgi:hypothetical protein
MNNENKKEWKLDWGWDPTLGNEVFDLIDYEFGYEFD